MNIEGGGVGIEGGGMAGSTLDIGPAIGSVGLPGNEGPVSSLEGFIPMGKSDINTLDLVGGVNKQSLRSVDLQPGFSLGGEIVFQAQPEANELVNSLNEADVLTEARLVLNQVKGEPQQERVSLVEEKVITEPEIIQEAAYWFIDVPVEERVVKPAEVISLTPQTKPLVVPFEAPNIFEYPAPQVFASPAMEPAVSTQRKTETGNSTAIAPVTAPHPVLQEEKEETEEIEETKSSKKETESLENEEAIEKKLYLEDHEVSTVRRTEIRQAITKARAQLEKLGLKKITGWLVAKFLPPEHEGNRSQVVKKTGPDGSYQETVEEIAGAGEFASVQQAVQRSDRIVAEKKPVKFGKEGILVRGIDVARVFKYRIIKPTQTYTEVVKRVVKKKVVVPQVVKVSEVRTAETEPTLRDFPALEGVFPKAA